MNDYTKVTFKVAPVSETATDILAAMLAEVGYETFVPEEEGMSAYVQQALFSEMALDEVVNDFPIDGYSIGYTVEQIEGEDWNAEWEKNYFQPILVDDKCVIHSTFHTDVPAAEYELLAPLAAKGFIIDEKRKWIFLNPDKYKNCSQEIWDACILGNNLEEYTEGFHMDGNILSKLAQESEAGAWKQSKLEKVKQYILNQL